MRRAPVLVFAAVLAGCATVAVRPPAMTLDEKIGQLFVYVLPGAFMNEGSPEYRQLLHQVRDNHVGGLHWATWSNVYETAFLIRRVRALAKLPLLTGADLEAGVGMRFAGTTYWPWAMAVGATGDPELARREGEITAEEARAIGLNQIDAPVADVNIDPDNPVINVRSFGEDPRDVARYVAAFIRGVQSEGVLATAKHFPGHGDTHTDSHRSLSVLRVGRERLESVELVPFRAAIEAGVGSVMTAHLSVPELDATPAPPREGAERDNPYTKDLAEVARDATVPASLSAAVTDGLLRRELGFGGLVVTDALDMGGITDHFEAGEAAVLSILAGADQVLKSPNVEAAIAGVKRAVQSGRISNARLDASIGRILAAKKRFPPQPSGVDEIFRSVESPEHRALSQEIARRSLTLVREAAGVLPLSRRERVVHVIVSDQPRFAEEVTDALRSRLDAAPASFLLDPLSTPADVETTVSGAAAADKVIVSVAARFQSGRGSIAIPPAGRGAIARILGGRPPVIVAVLGSPYLLRDFPAAGTALVAWGSQSDHQAALVRALFGETAIGGRLPVTIPGIAARGAGISRAALSQGAPK